MVEQCHSLTRRLIVEACNHHQTYSHIVLLVCNDPVCCIAFFNACHDCPYGSTGLGDMIIGSHLLKPFVNRLGLIRWATPLKPASFASITVQDPASLSSIASLAVYLKQSRKYSAWSLQKSLSTQE